MPSNLSGQRRVAQTKGGRAACRSASCLQVTQAQHLEHLADEPLSLLDVRAGPVREERLDQQPPHLRAFAFAERRASGTPPVRRPARPPRPSAASSRPLRDRPPFKIATPFPARLPAACASSPDQLSWARPGSAAPSVARRSRVSTQSAATAGCPRWIANRYRARSRTRRCGPRQSLRARSSTIAR